MAKYETPQYEILLKQGDFEIRKYQEFHTTSVDETNLKGYSGFNLLFDYISGNNKNRQPMAMTVPVINELNPKFMTMEFVVPSTFKKEAIPQPNNPNLKIKTYPSHIAAVLSFSGSNKEARIDLQINKLLEWIRKNKWTIKGSVRLSRYNSPFSLPMLRHNEVSVELKVAIDQKFGVIN
jgi:effector-binding domain-containing protein